MNVLEEWLAQAAQAVGLEGDVGGRHRDLVLDLARDVAHGVARPAAPLTTFLLGLAAGRAGGSDDDVRRLSTVLAEAASSWQREPEG